MDQASIMAFQLGQNSCITVNEKEVWAVPGDVVVDYPDGRRAVLRKIDFEQFVEDNGYTISGDIGAGWVVCRKV